MKKNKAHQQIFGKNYLGKWAILGQKIVYPHKSGSTGKIF